MPTLYSTAIQGTVAGHTVTIVPRNATYNTPQFIFAGNPSQASIELYLEGVEALPSSSSLRVAMARHFDLGPTSSGLTLTASRDTSSSLGEALGSRSTSSLTFQTDPNGLITTIELPPPDNNALAYLSSFTPYRIATLGFLSFDAAVASTWALSG
jgi:hypothetical protein